MTDRSIESTRAASLEHELEATQAALYYVSSALDAALEENFHFGRSRSLERARSWTAPSDDLVAAFERFVCTDAARRLIDVPAAA